MRTFKSHAAAVAAAERAAPNVKGDSEEQPDGGFRAIVLIREDQKWLEDRLRERGFLVAPLLNT